MKKSSELNIEERLCEYLKMNYRGSGNQVSSKQLEAFFSCQRDRNTANGQFAAMQGRTDL